jgi:thiosulfate/3-mercaptopyruvate sulfurtransferase
MVYFRPENLVSTEWMQNNINNPQIRIAEVNYDPSNYYQDCMPNAVLIDWKVLYLNR